MISSKRNRKFNHLVKKKKKQMGENAITNTIKVSVAGTSFKEQPLKKVRKNLRIIVQENNSKLKKKETLL